MIAIDELIKHYFTLEQRTERMRRRIKAVRHNFYSRSLHTRNEMINHEYVTVCVNVADDVTKLVDRTANLEESLKEYEFKLRQFNRFIADLDISDRDYLMNKYKHNSNAFNNDLLDKRLTDYIEEIETAVCYKFGYPIVTETDDVRENINVLLEQLEVMT